MFILGVDCAWTPQKPSGVALINYQPNKKAELIKLGRSYNEFCSNGIKWSESAAGSTPDFHSLLQFCTAIGWNVDVLALDIPLSPNLITGRRSCDDEISKAYGAKGAAVHTPNEQRPGKLSVDIFQQLNAANYIWNGNPRQDKSFIEVYPHASIIELMKLDYRLPYKVQKKNKYFPKSSVEERNFNLISNLNRLRNCISEYIDKMDDILPRLSPNMKYTTNHLKGYEDVLDALICAITGMFYVLSQIKSFGGDREKIWVANNKY